MSTAEKVFEWVLAGRQVGIRSPLQLEGRTLWTSVAVQAWGGEFKVFVDEIWEDEMAGESFLREETTRFRSVEQAAEYVDAHTRVRFHQLAPLRGQRIFNPALGE